MRLKAFVLAVPLSSMAIAWESPEQLGQWSAVQSWPIVAVHASLLPSGDVLAWTDYTTNSGAQIWRRSTNTFVPKSFNPVSLFCSGHVFLADGRLFVVGGIVGLMDDLGPHETTFFDPTGEVWSEGPLMSQGRYYPTATVLGDGRVFVSGGTTTCGTCYANRPEIYDPVADTFTPLAPTAQRDFKYYPHPYLLPDGRIIVAAQDDKAIDTRVLDLATQQWTVVDSRIIDGHSSVMYLPGKFMKSGKATADMQGYPAVATTFTLDMNQPTPQWQATAPMAHPRSFHNLTLLPDGQVLVTGGGTTTNKVDYANAVHAAELWSPVTRTWTTLASSHKPRMYHSTALLLPDATVLVAGSGRQNGRSQPDPADQQNAEIFSPPYLFRGPRPTISSAPADLSYGSAFMVVTPNAAQIASVALLAPGSVTHAFNQNQRYVPLAFHLTAGAGALSVQAPAHGNLAPPGPYMLFLVNTSGVPSVAAWTRVGGTGAVVPPVPDGTFGSPLRASRTSATSIGLTWDVASCAAPGYHVVYGTLTRLPTYQVGGGVCNLGTGGSFPWNGVPSGNLWFLVVADSGAIEGSWGDASAGPRKGTTASGVCGTTSRANSGACP